MSQNYQTSVFYINMMTSPKVVKSLLHINATENAHYKCHAINLHVGGPSKIVKEASVNILPPYQGKYSNIFIIHVFIFMQKKNIYIYISMVDLFSMNMLISLQLYSPE